MYVGFCQVNFIRKYLIIMYGTVQYNNVLTSTGRTTRICIMSKTFLHIISAFYRILIILYYCVQYYTVGSRRRNLSERILHITWGTFRLKKYFSICLIQQYNWTIKVKGCLRNTKLASPHCEGTTDQTSAIARCLIERLKQFCMVRTKKWSTLHTFYIW